MGSQETEVPFSTSTRGYLKYRIYDSTNTYDTGSNLFLQYQSDLRNAINKWDAIVSPNTTYFNSSPYYYTHQIEIDIDIKDFAVDHDTQMDIYLTNYVYFGFPASYGSGHRANSSALPEPAEMHGIPEGRTASEVSSCLRRA